MRLKTWMKIGLGLGALTLVLTGLSCSGGSIKLLVAAPLSGEQEQSGKGVLNGVQLAVDQWNAKGGIKGRKIVIIQGDDQGDPNTAVKLAKEWESKVDAVIGDYNSSCTLAAEEIYGKDKILMVTPSSTNPDVTDRGYFTIFRVCGRDDQQGKSAAKYVADHFPGAKVAVIHDKSSYGQDLANEFLKNYEFLTKTQAAFYGGIDRAQPVYTDEVNKVKAVDPTVVYFGGLWPQGAELLKEMRQAGMNVTFVSGDGCFDPQFIKRAGKDADGALVTFIPNQELLPSAKAVVEAYKQQFGPLLPYSLYGYTAADVVLQAMKQSGSTDPVTVSQTLHKMEFSTPMGTLKFDDKGDPQQSPYVMWQVENGKFVEVPMTAPAPAAAPAPAPEPAQK